MILKFWRTSFWECVACSEDQNVFSLFAKSRPQNSEGQENDCACAVVGTLQHIYFYLKFICTRKCSAGSLNRKSSTRRVEEFLTLGFVCFLFLWRFNKVPSWARWSRDEQEIGGTERIK